MSRKNGLWRVLLGLVLAGMLAGATSGCDGNNGDECDKCNDSSDCDGDLRCAETTLGKRCLEGSSCRINFSFMRSVGDWEEEAPVEPCRYCDTDEDCAVGETCELNSDDSYTCRGPNSQGCSAAPASIE